ncbi:UDP-2,3-diacylglucosamine diphosphatase [Cytophagales bacterium RKSG123]|nr:UDP-2,3-diacylglucosamine diphosphatase [Xanthovirga aplysinae]
MIEKNITLEEGKKIYFASDFHLGTPNSKDSLKRERKIIKWLNSIEDNAQAIFLLGDIFDFWYEYKRAIPKGFIRFQGKLAELTDKGIPVILFTGNHDMWMYDYFPKELNIPVYKDPLVIKINNKTFLLGHGDGLGPGDKTYKLLKKYIFRSKICKWAFDRLHPNIGIGIATAWSRSSKSRNMKKGEDEFMGYEKEWLYQYCNAEEKKNHHDFYVFGHRHLPLDLEINKNSRYINLGEWLNYFTYGEFDGEEMHLHTFEKEKTGIKLSE